MTRCSGRIAFVLLLAALSVAALTQAASAVIITLKSGNAPPTSPDPLITYLVAPTGSCATGFASPFTAADFATAAAGPAAWSVTPNPAWFFPLPCDTTANWIGVDAFKTPFSALYAIPFTIAAPCCIDMATLYFCWGVDDALGDAVNPAGVYVNGFPIPAISGGNFFFPSSSGPIDITPYVACGLNYLYVYDRDIGCIVSGVIFNATIDIHECPTPVGRTTWGGIKALYK